MAQRRSTEAKGTTSPRPRTAKRAPKVSVETAKLSALLHSAVDAIITIDAKGLIDSVNPAAEQLFGYPAVELIGSNISMLMPEPHRSRHDEYISHHIRTGERRIIGIGREVYGQRKDGTTFPMHLSVSAFEHAGRRYFTGIIHDLTNSKRNEAELLRQRGLFESIFKGLPDALFLTDLAGRIRMANPVALELFQVTQEEMVDRLCRDLFVSDDDYERLHDSLRRSAQGGTTDAIVCEYKRKDGTTFPGATTAAPLRDGGDQLLGHLCQMRNVSREQQRDAMLRRVQRLEAVGQLTGGLAHDFNNLLTVIIGNLELLSSRVSSEREQELVKDALEAAEMGHRLTDRLLTFSRQRALEPELLDLNGVVLDLIDMLRRTLGSSIAITTSLKADLWRTKADRGQVENAILNLAINSRDAMPKGGKLVIETRNVRLDLGTLPADGELKPGDFVRLTVTDSGCGMRPEVRDRAFEPFFTTKGKGRGTGLGLATVYGFARQSGGNATIYSEVNKGTSVSIYLPKVEPAAPLPDKAETLPTAPASGNRHILVVDDDERVRRLAVSRLEGMGYRVSQCDSGSAALERLATTPDIDLVFTDLTMPGLSGIDLCQRIREQYPGCGLLLTSGFAAELLEPESIEKLDVRFLRKPYRQTELAEAIAAALAETASRQRPD